VTQGLGIMSDSRFRYHVGHTQGLGFMCDRLRVRYHEWLRV